MTGNEYLRGIQGAARAHALTGSAERGEVPGLVTVASWWGEVYVDLIGTQTLGEIAPMRRTEKTASKRVRSTYDVRNECARLAGS